MFVLAVSSLERKVAKIEKLLPGPMADRLRAGVDTTIGELEAIGALPDRMEETL